MSRVCVTGGAGFIGSHLTRQLLDRGDEVCVLDNLSVGRASNLPPGVDLRVGDVLDPAALRQALDGCQSVVHLAARVAIRSSFEFATEDALANVAGTASALQAAEACGIRCFVLASSMAVYADSPTPDPITEGHPTHPVSPYGVSKLAAERLTQLCCKRAGIRCAVLRLFNTYGPGQALSPYVGVTTIFVDRLARGLPVQVFGDGEQYRDFVHVRDVAAALRAALESECDGEIFNVGSGEGVSVNALAAQVAREMGSEIRPVYLPGVEGELRNSIADIRKAARWLGYRPQHRLGASLRSVVQEILLARAA